MKVTENREYDVLPGHRSILLLLVIIVSVVAALIVFIPALYNGFVSDDGPYVVNNPHIRAFNGHLLHWSFTSLYFSNWHPMVYLSYGLDYLMWGLDPRGYHLSNQILHGINTLLVALVILRGLQALNRVNGGGDLGGRFNGARGAANLRTGLIVGSTALLFAVHPIHVESVAWVAERKDLLCALFFLLSLWSYLGYVMSLNSAHTSNGIRRRYWQGYLASLSFFTLALMSKPMAISLPLVLLLIDIFPLRRLTDLRQYRFALVDKIPFVALSLISAVITIMSQQAGGSVMSLETASFSSRLLIAAQSLIRYLCKLAWPSDLSPFYPHPGEVSLLSWDISIATLSVVVITIIAIIYVRRYPVALLLWSIYIVTLGPVLGLVQVGGQAMADRYVYLPGIAPLLGIGLILGSVGVPVNRSAGSLHRWRPVVAVSITVVMALSYGVVTWKQIAHWKDDSTYWQRAVEVEPSMRAYSNLAAALYRKGDYHRALEVYYEAAAAYPHKEARLYDGRGLVFAKLGRYHEALLDYSRAIALNPRDHNMFYNRGNVRVRMGLYREAIQDYTAAIRLHPQPHPHYFQNRSVAYRALGDISQAAADLAKARHLKGLAGSVEK